LLYIHHKRNGGKVNIYDDTLEDRMGDNVGGGLYMTTHNLHENDINLDNNLIQLDILMKDKEALIKAEILWEHDMKMEELKNTNNLNIQPMKGRLPELVEILKHEMRCSYM
jgi:hypothetical protein